MRRAVYVMPHDSEWIVRIAGEEEPVAVCKTQQDAIHNGVSIAKEMQTELIVHRLDGSIRSRDSYSGSFHFNRTKT